MRSNLIRAFLLPSLLLPGLASAATTINLTAGWNLVGNGDSTAIDVAARLNDQAKITTVWKWNKVGNKWAFYAPSMAPDALVAYAQSKGYDVLASIAPKEGFWVNAVTAATLTDPMAAPPVLGAPAVTLAASDLNQGWNLMGSADNKNPSQLNTGLSSSLNAAGKSIVTVWAWDAPTSKWKFFAPALEAQGGTALASYITGKGYLAFSTAPSATDGFWMNIGPASVVVPPAPALDLAKTFMSTLRSNVTALGASDLSLQTELQAVANDMKNRTAPMAGSNAEALKIAYQAVRFWNDIIKNDSATFTPSQNFYADSYNPMPSGGCTFYRDENYTITATAKDEAKYVACAVSNFLNDRISATDANGVQKACSIAGDWCQTVWSVRVRLHPDASDTNKFTVYTQTRESRQTAKTFGYSYWDTAQNTYINGAASCPTGMECMVNPISFDETRTHYGAASPGNAATLVTQRDSGGAISGVTLVGELSPAYSVQSNYSGYYDASLQRWISKPNAVATIFGDKHNVALSGALTHPIAGVDRFGISGSMDLIKNGSLETRFELADGSYLQASSASVSAAQANTPIVQDGSHEVLLKIKGGTAASTISGEMKVSAFKRDASNTNYMPTLVSFAGGVQRNGVSFFDGTMTVENLNYPSFNDLQPMSSTNFQTSRVGFVGNINIPNRTVLQVNLLTNQKSTGNNLTNTSDASGQYVQGALTVNLSASSNAAADVVTLESTNGVKLVIDKSIATFPITVGGQTMGVYSTANRLLTYTDNSYEQF